MTFPERDATASDYRGWTDISDLTTLTVAGGTDNTAEPSAVCLCTPEGTITDATPSFADCFETVDRQPVGSSLEQWLSVARNIDSLEPLLERLTDRTVVSRKLAVPDTNGETTPLVFEARLLEFDGQSVIVAVCREKTVQRRIERRYALLAESSRIIGEAKHYRDGLERMLQAICTYTEWAYGEVWTPADQADELAYTLGYTDDPKVAPFQAERTELTFGFGEGLPGRVFTTQSPEWIPDASEEPPAVFHLAGLAVDVGVRAALGVPVMAGDRVVAVVAFFLTEQRLADDSLINDVSAVVNSLGGLLERKQTEASIRRRNKRLEEFAAVVSHDLRNPLNVATGALEMVQDETESEYLETVADAHDRMDELIKDILVLAKQGKTVHIKEPVVLAESIETCWKRVETPQATLRVDTDRVIQADRSRLRQILENVFRNAVVHGGPETTVTVGNLETGFYIADDGPGVPARDRETVFEPGHTTHTEGNGLGLAIVQDIVAAHGWQIAVTASACGGARFEITGVECVGSRH